MPKLVLIVALANNGAIGLNGDLPWGRSLPRDMARFKELTLKTGIVLMGRKTAESLPGPLKDRRNLVLTRSNVELKEGFEVMDSLEAAIRAVPKESVIAVIGGAEIYRLTAPFASLCYLTVVGTALPGDTFFPVKSFDAYERKGGVQSCPSDAKNAHAVKFVTLRNTVVQELPA